MTTTTTTPAQTAAIEKIADFVGYLSERWKDERHYEDFGAYKIAAQEACTRGGFTFVSLTKTFTMIFRSDAREYCMKVSRGTISWGSRPL